MTVQLTIPWWLTDEWWSVFWKRLHNSPCPLLWSSTTQRRCTFAMPTLRISRWRNVLQRFAVHRTSSLSHNLWVRRWSSESSSVILRDERGICHQLVTCSFSKPHARARIERPKRIVPISICLIFWPYEEMNKISGGRSMGWPLSARTAIHWCMLKIFVNHTSFP